MRQAGVVGAGGQLPVGESPGTSLAKLNVGLRVQFPPLPEGLHMADPLLHGLPPLQEDGVQPGLRQAERSQQARRAAAHHHRGQG